MSVNNGAVTPPHDADRIQGTDAESDSPNRADSHEGSSPTSGQPRSGLFGEGFRRRLSFLGNGAVLAAVVAAYFVYLLVSWLADGSPGDSIIMPDFARLSSNWICVIQATILAWCVVFALWVIVISPVRMNTAYNLVLGSHGHTPITLAHRRNERYVELNIEIFTLITWLLPVLGFVGTVLGITEAIVGLQMISVDDGAGANPGVTGGLEDRLTTVLSGLTYAFDTTFVGLVCAIVAMVIRLGVVTRLNTVLDATFERRSPHMGRPQSSSDSTE